MIAGALLGIAVTGLYMVGSGRAFGYDAAVTMEYFVDGPPTWPFTRQVVWNNHPIFSFVTGVVADATRSTSEVTMRVGPAVFGALAVALLTWRVGRRLSWHAGFAGGLVVACHPLMFDMAREVRGYTLALLAITCAAVAVLDVHSPVLFGVAAFVAVGTHLHAVIPIAALIAYLFVTRGLSRPWRLSTMAAALASLTVYAGTLAESGRGGGRLFRPTFLRDALWELLGRDPYVVITVGLLVAVGAAALTWREGRWALVVVAGGGLVAAWIVAPFDLYSRFVYWALPAVGFFVAVAVQRHPAGLALVVAVAGVSATSHLPEMGDDELPNRAVVEAAGAGACIIGEIPEYLAWYADDLIVGDRCDRGVVPPKYYGSAYVARAQAVWPITCREIGGAQVRAVSAQACPD